MKYFSFKGVYGRTGCRPTRYLTYTNGVVMFAPVIASDGTMADVWNLIDYDLDETYFREYVLSEYALKSDIPTDLVNSDTLTSTLNGNVLKDELPPTADLSEYRKLDDLSVSTRVYIPF